MTRKRKPKRYPGRCVEEHVLFDEISEMLASGCSPDWVRTTLSYQHQVAIADGDIAPLPDRASLYAWRSSRMPAATIVPPRLLEEKMSQLTEHVDLMRALTLLYAEAENRVAKMFEIQQKLDFPLPNVDQAIQTLLRIGEQLWQVGGDCGLFPRPAGATVAMGVRGADGSAAFMLLKVGEGPSRMVDLRNPDLSVLSEPEMAAVGELVAKA